MKSIVLLIDLVFMLTVMFFASYLAFLTLLAIIRGPRGRVHRAKSYKRFAVLIPAHNEETGIVPTLRSIVAVEYPADHFDIFVIADNCTDKTADLARSLGAGVYERYDQFNKGKGQALRWCLDRLILDPRKYEAFVVIDADTVVSRNLLAVMNGYLEQGASCIQCSDLVARQPGSWSPEITRIAFTLHNFVRPLGKMTLGLSAGLNGNGMCFSRDLIVHQPWTSYSRVEDLEHAIQLVLRGISVQFAPEAVIHATMPSNERDAESQRRRWELARFPVIRKYAIPLLSAALRKRSAASLDMFVELVTPALANLFTVTCAALCIHATLTGVGVSWLRDMTVLCLLTLALEVFHVLGGLYAARAGTSDLLVLANIPKYIFWKVRLYARAWLTGDDRIWIRTQRSDRLAR